MLIIALNGSPNIDGNMAALLKYTLEQCEAEGAETRIFNCGRIMDDQEEPFCIACSSPCDGRCYEDKQMAEVFETISRADGLIIGSPVYFGIVSAQLKAFWDKTRSLRAGKSLLNVVGGAMAVGASRFGGQEETIRAIHTMMLVQGMILVGDGYYEDDCGHFGAAGQRPVDTDLDAFHRARILGKRIIETAEATRSLRRR